MNAVKSDLNTISENMVKSGTSVEEKWSSLKEQIIETANKHIPRKTLKEKYNIPWLTRSIKKMMKKRSKLYNKARKTRLDQDWAKYRRVRNNIRRALDDAHEKYINDILNVDALKEKPKRFCRYIKSKKKDQLGISALRSNKGLVTEGKGKAELLSEQYTCIRAYSLMRILMNFQPFLQKLHN